jgi:membrane protein
MNLQDKIEKSSPVQKILQRAKITSLPGFDNEPIYNVVKFFILEIRKGSITIQSKAVAFTFFLALFPSIIFVFTLIPYLPISGLQDHILMVLLEFLPNDVYSFLDQTIIDILSKRKGGLLSAGLFVAFMLSTNAMMGVMDTFDRASGTIRTRKGYQQRGIAFMLTVIVFALLVMSLLLIVSGNILLKVILDQFHILNAFNFIFFSTLKWMAIIVLFFSAVSAIYHFGPSLKQKWSITSAGSTLATFLIIAISIGFSFFVDNFGRFNEIYGSLGVVIALQIFIYLNSFALLIGYELNISIRNAKENHTEEEIREEV